MPKRQQPHPEALTPKGRQTTLYIDKTENLSLAIESAGKL